jgi:hypothetical protein
MAGSVDFATEPYKELPQTISILLSQGIERSKKKERDGGTAGWWSSQKHNIYQLSLPSYIGTIPGVPKQFSNTAMFLFNPGSTLDMFLLYIQNKQTYMNRYVRPLTTAG